MSRVNKEMAVDTIVELMGGKENITFATHCMTRLRFNVKDKSQVKEEQIDSLSYTVGSQWQSDQFQIIIGPTVGEYYNFLAKKLDNNVLNAESIDAEQKNPEKEKRNFNFYFSKIVDAISGSLIPLIPLLIGAGMLKVIVILGSLTGILVESSSTFQVLSFAADSGFYFLPVFLGATAATKFKTNMGLGMLLGAILIHPVFVANVAENTKLNIFGLPIYGTNYANSIFPIIMAVFIMSYVERYFKKIFPESIKTIMVPLLTIIIMLPLTLCLIGPAGSFLGVYLANGIMWLYNTVGFLGVAVLAGLYPLLVITGMHGAFIPYMFQSFATFGYEPIVCIAGVISNINQGAAALAVSFKSKNKTIKEVAAPSSITAIIGGVTEPALFGVNLRYKTPLYAAMAGSFIGGAVAGLLKVYAYAFGGSAGIFGLAGFISKNQSNIVYAIISVLVGFISTFIITFIIYKDKDQVK